MRWIVLFGVAMWLGLGSPSTSIAQPAQDPLIREHDGKSSRALSGSPSRIRRSFRSDDQARAVFKQILDAAGLAGMEDRITLRASAETDNAVAEIETKADGSEERLIFYSPTFMQALATKTKTNWSMFAVLAHEVGHHVRFHTAIDGRNHEFELEADYQAGFILRRMGATLEQTQAAFKVFPQQETDSHPGGAQRVQMATLGWMSARNADPTPPPPPGTTSSISEVEVVRVCREVEGMTNISVLRVLANQHKGTLAAHCIEARIEEVTKSDIAKKAAEAAKVEAERRLLEAEAQVERKRRDEAELLRLRAQVMAAEEARREAERRHLEDAKKTAAIAPGSIAVPVPVPAQCGWYAIAYCSKDGATAQSYTGNFGGYVINTNHYPKFTGGWFCVVEGPMLRDAATLAVQRMKGAGAATAYIKNSC